MASLVRNSLNWLKMAWSTQPVLFISVVLGTAGKWKEGDIKCLS